MLAVFIFPLKFFYIFMLFFRYHVTRNIIVCTFWVARRRVRLFFWVLVFACVGVSLFLWVIFLHDVYVIV